MRNKTKVVTGVVRLSFMGATFNSRWQRKILRITNYTKGRYRNH